ncbi:insulinase family protein [Xenorhabdus bovienii]|nr:insulinase family protein [Xenorhabdus bovienii]MDE9538544.1 insulinase family protein [Xenorhabdus bovienii]
MVAIASLSAFTQPAERDPIVSLNTVRHASSEQAKAYYRDWYQPQRMTLVVIGKLPR